ncbi:hypothetical protein AVEN_270346-1 [Araneus ventricosus]|uniref:Uncharacterized protein n=1 Tax=Araneus ventricosus TaxID=182803 RepID=A0A4Y2MPA1_ARAVE|nr:hypothetical protein AVEN_201784-1 [Araneus ventricosus]GBN28372.1 hypothetical protein AVEN_270346-1 [Araneus ventricosus]
MAALFGDSRIITPPSSSLLHSALLKVAFSLLSSKTDNTDIRNENSGASIKGLEEVLDVICNRADEDLHSIPGGLRRRAFAAVHGLHYAVEKWKGDHSQFLRYKDGGHFFHWRSDGTIDSVKTAEHLVMDENINIRERFDLACLYSLEQSIQTLWTEMESSGESENFSSRVRFWVRWLRDGSQVAWTQLVREYLDPPPIFELRFSSLLPLLQSEERNELFFYLRFATDDDFRYCLYLITQKEEVQIMEMYAARVLRLHLNWPLQSLFLETAEKVWKYIDDEDFNSLLYRILYLKKFAKDYDYGELFEDFWNMSPTHLKESVKGDPNLREVIDKNKKRKADDYKPQNSKKEKYI